MDIMNKIQKDDIQAFAKNFELKENIAGSKFLITGATGLIGSTLAHCLLALDCKIKITCPIRNLEKARTIYGDKFDGINFIETDLLEYLANLSSHDNFDHIIHCASPTEGKYMTAHPVETYALAIGSTCSLLRFAKQSGIRGMVYVSSLEYYGQNLDDNVIVEDFQGHIDMNSPRSSYPMGKRAAEYLCTAYAEEFNVPVKIARLTQTFGAGIAKDDNRVFAQFAKSIVKGQDIVLHTTGESAKPYCYTTDCISGILYILLKGHNGEAYNVANPETYISIRQLAEYLCKEFNPNVKVVTELDSTLGYAPVTRLRLSSDKLMGLGWRPQLKLYDMFYNLIESVKYENNN